MAQPLRQGRRRQFCHIEQLNRSPGLYKKLDHGDMTFPYRPVQATIAVRVVLRVDRGPGFDEEASAVAIASVCGEEQWRVALECPSIHIRLGGKKFSYNKRVSLDLHGGMKGSDANVIGPVEIILKPATRRDCVVNVGSAS